MEQMTLDGLIRAAADRPTEPVLKQLLKALHAPEGISASSITEKLEEIWLSWSSEEEDISPEQATFLIDLAAASLAHTPAFRALFFDAVRSQLPPYLNRTVFLRAMGVGEEGELYNGIGRGLLNISGMPVYRDEKGGVATPTSDEERTKITLDTCTLQMNINGFGEEMPMEEAVAWSVELLKRYASATDIETAIVTV